MAENNLVTMLFWLGELTLSSWILSYGAEHLSEKFGAKFVGRVLLSIATTLPEIAIVIYAAAQGSFGIAIGSVNDDTRFIDYVNYSNNKTIKGAT
jgi:cation:H+ antiporter